MLTHVLNWQKDQEPPQPSSVAADSISGVGRVIKRELAEEAIAEHRNNPANNNNLLMIAPLKIADQFSKIPVPFVAPIKTEMPSDEQQQLQLAEVEDVKRIIQQRYAENNFSNKLFVRAGRPDVVDRDLSAVQKNNSSLSVHVSQLSNGSKDASRIPYSVLMPNQQRSAASTSADPLGGSVSKTRNKRKSCGAANKNGEVKRKK